VNLAGDGERLPSTIGGMVDLALETYVERLPLYLLLALVIVAAVGAIDYLVPAADQQGLLLRGAIEEWVYVLLSAFAITAVALDIGERVAGERSTTRVVLRAALTRWARVALTLILVQFIVDLTAPAGAMSSEPTDPLTLALAPVIWLFWGVLSLAPPLAALSTDRGAAGAVLSLLRAVGFALRAANLPRLALIGIVTVAPALLETVLNDKAPHSFVHAAFWCAFPIDALATAPLAAIQTAFALDFVRRSTATPPRR
jgi:hypothetical protein